MKPQITDIVIIGAGQAGLALGYYFAKSNYNYLIIDAAREVGDSWKRRYDSLKLFTPRNYSSLPGMDFPGDPEGYPNKDEVADYLSHYAHTFHLNIQLNTTVIKLLQAEGKYIVHTSAGTIEAQQVVVATVPFQKPFIPQLEGALSSEVKQLHSSEYKNPFQIIGNNVLVVGAGNSGAQIAVELAASHTVSIAARRPLKFRPYTVLGKSLFWWIDKLGVLNASKDSWKGKRFKAMGDPIIGLELKQDIKLGNIKRKAGVKELDGTSVVFADGTSETFDTVIWATGFRHEYSWLNIPGLFDIQGNPLQQRGITQIPGFYFLGLTWMYSRNSALIGGVGKDAAYLAQYLLGQS